MPHVHGRGLNGSEGLSRVRISGHLDSFYWDHPVKAHERIPYEAPGGDDDRAKRAEPADALLKEAMLRSAGNALRYTDPTAFYRGEVERIRSSIRALAARSAHGNMGTEAVLQSLAAAYESRERVTRSRHPEAFAGAPLDA